jgi:hypothetical protein
VDNYIIVKPNPDFVGGHLVWNFRKKIWTNQVTNGCRYKAVKGGRWVGLKPPKSCEDAHNSMVNQDFEIQTFLERYIATDFYGSAFSKGLTFA